MTTTNLKGHTMLTHPKIETDMTKAMDGRWVLLVGIAPDDLEPEDDFPPVVLGRWIGNLWLFIHVEGAGSIGTDDDPVGFVELSDLGLFDAPQVAS